MIKKVERNVILVLGYSDDLAQNIEENILKTYDISNNYSIGYHNSLYETIKFIFTTDSNVLLYSKYIPLDTIKMIQEILYSENLSNDLIIYNYIDDLVDCSLTGKNNYYDKYNPIDYCDIYYEENISTGFFKIYNDHVSKVKRLCDRFSYELSSNAKYHDSDKIMKDDILKAYAIYYPELKKIPYFEEDGVTRNKEYLDYEEKYMEEPMSKHCMYENHHYYDWKNSHDATLMDMIEAIFDVYTAITLSSNESLDLKRFTEIIKSKGIIDNIEEKIINTILDIELEEDDVYISKNQYLKEKLNSDKYRKLERKDALDYIKNRNKVFYNQIMTDNNYSNIQYLKEDGYFYRINRDYATINIYINKENENDVVITKESIVFGNDPYIKILKLNK